MTLLTDKNTNTQQRSQQIPILVTNPQQHKAKIKKSKNFMKKLKIFGFKE